MMNSLFRSMLLGLLAMGFTLLIGCVRTDVSVSPVSSSPSASGSPATAVTAAETIKFKSEAGAEVFSIEPRADGAKLVDAAEVELARFTQDGQKVKIKNPADETLGYVVMQSGYWKLENAEQTQELYILRQQDDGDYKLETGSDRPIYRIKARDYGFEIETPDKQSLYKVKLKEGKISLRNANDQTILSTRSSISPIAVACFGFDELTREQQAGLAYAVNLQN
ncbi:MAG: hypothetical protein Kow00121_60350 [Elainellaceae cyanobacterium]